MKDCIYIIITFFYVFFFKFVNVPFLSILDSTIIIGIMLAPIIFFSTRNRNVFLKLLFENMVLSSFLGCSVLILMSIWITLVHDKSDFSLCRPLVHQLIFLFVGIEYISFLIVKNRRDKALKYIIIAYVIQSIIQYLAFLSPTFHLFTNWFKTPEQIDLQRFYDGFRLNAISGGIAFSLAAGYAIITVIFVIRWREFKQWNDYIKLIILGLLLAGGLVAGRTAILLDFVGLFCMFFCKFITKKHTSRVNRAFTWMFVTLPFVLIICTIIGIKFAEYMGPDFQRKLMTVKWWLQKWTFDYFGVGKTETGITFWGDMLSRMPSLKTLLIGDGLYEVENGANYLSQDAGYIRTLAFGGVVWLIALFIYQKMFLRGTQKRKLECMVLMIIILIGTLKADFLGILLQSQLILFVVYVDNIDELKKEQYYGKYRKGNFDNCIINRLQ